MDQFRVLGHNVTIYRNDCDLEKLVETAVNTPDTILALSPGPGTPSEAGILLPLIERLKKSSTDYWNLFRPSSIDSSLWREGCSRWRSIAW